MCNLQIALEVEHPIGWKSVGSAARADHSYKVHRRKIKTMLNPIAVSAGCTFKLTYLPTNKSAIYEGGHKKITFSPPCLNENRALYLSTGSCTKDDNIISAICD